RERYVGEGSCGTCQQVAQRVRVSRFVTNVCLNADRPSSGAPRAGLLSLREKAILSALQKIDFLKKRERGCYSSFFSGLQRQSSVPCSLVDWLNPARDPISCNRELLQQLTDQTMPSLEGKPCKLKIVGRRFHPSRLKVRTLRCGLRKMPGIRASRNECRSATDGRAGGALAL